MFAGFYSAATPAPLSTKELIAPRCNCLRAIFALLFTTAGLLLGSPGSANTLLVPSVYSTLGLAAYAAQPGDTIQLAPGTYYVTGLELNGKAITITGDTAADTIIDGSQGSGAILFFENFDANNPYGTHGIEATIENLTFQNARCPQSPGQSNGGSAMVIAFASPVISHCIFKDNISSGSAGNSSSESQNNPTPPDGVSGISSLNDCDFFSDWGPTESDSGETYEYGGPGGSSTGGAISAFNSAPTIEYCDFVGNASVGGIGGPGANGGDGWGGAISLGASDGGLQILSHCTFENNSAIGGAGNGQYSITVHNGGVLNLNGGYAGGGALCLYAADAQITDCYFSANSSSGGAAGGGGYADGWAEGGAIRTVGGLLTIQDCVFNANNTSAVGVGYAVGGSLYANALSNDGQTVASVATVTLNASTISNGNCAAQNSQNYGSAVHIDQFDGSISNFNAENDIFYGDAQLNSFGPLVLSNAQGEIYGSDVESYYVVNNAVGFASCFFSENPSFINDSAGNLHLTWNSPCIAYGIADPNLPTTDYDGNPRPHQPSMGAYEFERTISPIGAAVAQSAGIPIAQPFFQIVDSDGAATASSLPSSDLQVTWGDASGSGTGTAVLDHVDSAGAHFDIYDSANPPHSYAASGTYYPEMVLNRSLLANYYSYTSNGATSTATIGGGSMPVANLSLTTSANTSPADVAVTFTATINNPQQIYPGGTMYFYANGSYIGQAGMGVTVDEGGIEVTFPYESAFTWASNAPGSYTIVAKWSGDSVQQGGQASVGQTFEGYATGELLLGDSVTPAGFPSEFQVEVTPLYTFLPQSLDLNPIGSVSVYDGSTLVGSASLSPYGSPDTSTAIIVGKLPTAGLRTLTLSYAGEAGLYAPSSIQVNVTVPQVPTTIKVSASPSALEAGKSTTFTATLDAGSGLEPTGTVQFTVDGADIGAPVAVLNASASLATAALTVGTHVVSAIYSGDTNDTAVTAAGVLVRVTADTMKLQLSSRSKTGGKSLTGTVELGSPAPKGGRTITLSSSDPAAASVPASIQIDAGDTMGTFTITTTKVAKTTKVAITAKNIGSVSTDLFVEP